MIIDSHLHIWSENRKMYPRADTPYPGSVELLLDYMDEAGVDRAVIVLPMHYRYDNRLLADTIEDHDGKFAGVGVVDPVGPHAAEELTRLVEEDGIRGVRIRGPLEPDAFCDPVTDPLWRCAAELSVPICILTTADKVDPVRRMVERFPETPVVIDHFAQISAADGVNCAPFQTFLSLAEFPLVNIKLSGLHYWGDRPYPYDKAHDNLHAAFAAFGAERMLWGSDWPHILFGGGYIRCLNFVRREMDWLSEDEKAQILGKTAERIWWNGRSERKE